MTTNDQFRQLQAAIAHQKAGRLADAVRACKRLLRETPKNFDGVYLLAMLHAQQGDLKAAIAMFRRAAQLRPDIVEIQYNLAVALSMTGDHDEAAQYYERILETNPRHANARNNYAASLLTNGRAGDAVRQYDVLIAGNPGTAEAYNNRGMALQYLKRADEALRDYDRAIALKPGFAEAHANRGNALAALDRADEALASFRQATALKPDFADAFNNAANIYSIRGLHSEALDAFDHAMALKSDDSEARSMRLYAKMHLCDWRNFDAECAAVISCIKGGSPIYPFVGLAVTSSPADQLQCATQFGKTRFPAAAKPLWNGEIYRHDRLRVAYLSADLHEHATGYLTAGLFEQHDKARFETTAISLRPEKDSEFHRRLRAPFDRFVDGAAQSDVDIAALIRKLEIDVVVDLNGFTRDARTGILAQRPAPVQVNWLGYAGTMGVEFIDYIIADPIVIPEDQFPFYSEKVVWLPDCYQANDSRRLISDRMPARRTLQLPDAGFVFCCFNLPYKITPGFFDIWMRLLKRIDGSVLWLLEEDASTSRTLRHEAERRGVTPNRLVFAPHVPLADHLARHRAADLALDTLPYNAHTTASDALWAGLPIVTCLGSTFAGRVGASLLKSVGLAELVAGSLADYETLALRIATTRQLCSDLKQRLAHNRGSFPLFDTGRFARHIEAAYVTMAQARQDGRAPAHFAVTAIS